MAGPDLQSLLGIQPLTSLIQTFDEEESPKNKFFTSIFEQGEQQRPPGDEVRWEELIFSRGLAPVVGPDSPHPRVARTDQKVHVSPLATIKLHTDVSARRLFKQRAPGREVADAAAVIGYELKNLRQRIAKSIEKMCARTLLGELVVNKDEFEGSEIEFRVKHNVNTYARTKPWSDKSTQIVTDELTAFTEKFAKDSGLEPQTAIMNVEVEKFLRRNDEIRTYAANERFAPNLLQSKVMTPQVLAQLGLGGLNWKKSIGYYTDSKGAAVRFLTENKVVLLPDDAELPNVLGFALGTSWVPRELWGSEGSLGWEEMPPGYCAYSETIKSPAGVRLYAEWTGLPYVKFGKGVCVGTIE